MKGKKNWDWFECHICKFKSEDEEDFIYCDECNKPTCEKCIRHIEHQGYSESICINCIKRLKIKEYDNWNKK